MIKYTMRSIILRSFMILLVVFFFFSCKSTNLSSKASSDEDSKEKDQNLVGLVGIYDDVSFFLKQTYGYEHSKNCVQVQLITGQNSTEDQLNFSKETCSQYHLVKPYLTFSIKFNPSLGKDEILTENNIPVGLVYEHLSAPIPEETIEWTGHSHVIIDLCSGNYLDTCRLETNDGRLERIVIK